MFASPAWQALQLAWEDADDGDEDADQVWRALALTPGARVLDVPCGTGRLGRRLRDRGCRVVGIDATTAFLLEAAAAGVPVVRADMRTRVVARGAFDAVLCWWGSFGYFDEEDNRAQADAAVASLIPGGRYLIDTFVADSILPRFVPEAEWDVADINVRESRRYDERERRISTTWTFTRDGETTTQIFLGPGLHARRADGTPVRGRIRLVPGAR